MTRYILNSGGISRSSDQGKSFFNEVIKGLGSNPKLLICLFAQAREDWEKKFVEYSEAFTKFLPKEIKLETTLAFPETFEEQLADSDAIYLSGGDDHLIQYWLRKFDLPKLWQNKTVATNSASSHAVSKYFWTCDWRRCMDGLGILPIKFLAHYKSEYGLTDPRGPIDWAKGYQELQKYGDAELPILALEEGDFRIFEI